MSRVPISAVILTLNEERNLEYCLRSLRSWVDEIVVVDMHSEDRTPDIAERYADQVVQHDRIEAFDAARSEGIRVARNEWIFSIDADEVVPVGLSEWITGALVDDPAFDIALIPRANVFLGKWLRSSNWWPGLPRLFRRDSLDITAQLHKGLRPRAGARIQRLPRDPAVSLWHFSYPSLEVLTQKLNRYTTIEARQSLARGVRQPKPRNLFTKAVKKFVTEYIRRRGYRDGMAGLTYGIHRAYYRYMAMAKRWDEAEAPSRQARYDEMRDRILSRYPDGGRVDSNEGQVSLAAPATDRQGSQ